MIVIYSHPASGNTTREVRINAREKLNLIRVFETSTGQLVYDHFVDLNGAYFNSLVVRFSPQERRVAVQRNSSQIDVFNIDEPSSLPESIRPAHPEDEFYGFSFNADEDLVLTTQSSKVLIHRFQK